MDFKHYALVVIFLVAPAQAQWKPETYSFENDHCVTSCDTNNPNSHDKCVNYCTCWIVEMQKEFPDYDQVLREIKKEQNPDRIAATQTIVDACNRKTFGGPAKKLNF